jgi:hypothetical protein
MPLPRPIGRGRSGYDGPSPKLRIRPRPHEQRYQAHFHPMKLLNLDTNLSWALRQSLQGPMLNIQPRSFRSMHMTRPAKLHIALHFTSQTERIRYCVDHNNNTHIQMILGYTLPRIQIGMMSQMRGQNHLLNRSNTLC